ncbi:hypothetical protein BGZ46_002805 [Entomortierella lignicola]|nr:hypothetical protein BGZ46_002805 [Entomortierella lignicola]
MTRKDVSFLSDNLRLAGHLFVPDSYKEGDKLPAIVTVHPYTGVKEQTAGLYANKLSEQGFITLAFDRRHQGASEGFPRQFEDPFGMGEDVKAAVTYLSLQDQVDPSRIGVLGICAGGGYAIFAASTDHRIKATATVSGVDLGGFIRTIPKPELDAILVEAGKARIEFAKTGQVKYVPVLPSLSDVTKDTPNLMAEGADYYLTPRGGHPTSINRNAVSSFDRLVAYDSFTQIDRISPRPLLLIAGSKADTLLYSEKAYELAKEPKELFIVDGSTHIALYDQNVPKALPKLIEFFKQKL